MNNKQNEVLNKLGISVARNRTSMSKETKNRCCRLGEIEKDLSSSRKSSSNVIIKVINTLIKET